MESVLKSSRWQDWTLIGLRCALVIFAGVILFTSRNADGVQVYASNDMMIALVIGVIATVVLVIPAIFPALEGLFAPIVMIGDWAMAAAFAFAVQGNTSLSGLFGALIVVASVIRLGPIWGIGDVVGVMGGVILAAGARDNFQNISQTITNEGSGLVFILSAGIAVIVWGFAVQRQFRHNREQIADLHLSKTTQIEDLRVRTRAIYEMAATLSSTLNYEKILNAAMSAGSLGLHDLDKRGKERLVSAVLLFRSVDNALHVVTGRGLARTDETRSTPGKEGLIGETLQKCMPVFGTSARKDPELQYFVAFQSARSTLCIPLRAGYDNYGVLIFGSEIPNAFTDDHTEMLTAIGTQATIALQNAVLYENLLSERDRIVDVEEEARKKLARDLHDGPTQNVAAIAMRMGIIGKIFERTPVEVPGELKKVEELARKTTKEIRHMLFTLRPLVLENQGLAAALEQLAEKMKETHGQAVAVRVARDAEKALDSHQQGVIFYIVEEAVGNARKHAQAQLIQVTVTKQDDVVFVQVADNGVGFDTSAVEANYDQRGSLGMVNLRERTELLGGSLRIESAVGRGTAVTVLVPIKEALAGASSTRLSRRVAETGSTTKLAAAAIDRIRNIQSSDL